MNRKTTPNRRFRIADQIQRDLAEIIRDELKDPRTQWVTIMSVDITPDYAHAKILFSLLQGDKDQAEQALNQSAGFIRNFLFKRLHIHTVPTLHFKFDDTPEKAAHINSLIQQALASSSADLADDESD